MKVKTKFRVSSVTAFEHGGTVTLYPVFSEDDGSENRKFWESTPSGEITLTIMSDALNYFVPGLEVYVDFSYVPEEDA